MRMTNFYLLRS